MPALRVFGRKWLLGSDDFVVFPIAYALLRFAIALVVIIDFPTLFERNNNTCKDLRWFACVAFLLHILLAAAHVAMSVASGQGHVFEPSVRHVMVPLLLYICGFFWLLEVADVAFWFYLTDDEKECCVKCVAAAKVSAFTSISLLIFHIVSVVVTFDVNGRNDLAVVGWRDSPAYVDQWESRIRMMFCCARPGKETRNIVYRDVANLFANMFRHVDLVPSDIALGMLLINRADALRDTEMAQRNKTKTMMEPRIKHSSQFTAEDIRKPNANDRENLKMVETYSPYIIAAYGWSMLFLNFPLTFVFRAFPRLFSNRHCATVWLKERPNVELFHFSDMNTKLMLPFFVAADHVLKTIVISIRGTLSADDVLADIWAEITPFPQLSPDMPNGYVHKGMFECAKCLESDLIRKEIIASAFRKCPTYQLVVCGHSLGGGVAVILSLLLRSSFPALQCLSYSPPGALFTYDLANFCAQFCVSVIVGKDIVPRLSETSIGGFRDELVHALSTTRRSKASTFFCHRWFRDISALADASGESRFIENRFVKFKKIDHRESRVKMFAPGKVYHFMKTHSESFFFGLCHVKHYVPIGNCDIGSFQRIKVSASMVSDHMPYNVKDAIRQTNRALADGTLDVFFTLAREETADELLTRVDISNPERKDFVDHIVYTFPPLPKTHSLPPPPPPPPVVLRVLSPKALQENHQYSIPVSLETEVALPLPTRDAIRNAMLHHQTEAANVHAMYARCGRPTRLEASAKFPELTNVVVGLASTLLSELHSSGREIVLDTLWEILEEGPFTAGALDLPATSRQSLSMFLERAKRDVQGHNPIAPR